MMRDRQKKDKKNMGAYAVIAACLLGLGAFVVSAVMGSGTKDLKSNGCIGDSLPGTVVVSDTSPPLWGETQKRSMLEFFSLLYHERLRGNEKFTVYATTGDKWSNLPMVKVTLCKPVQDSQQALQLGAKDLAEPYLRNQDKLVFKKLFWPGIEAMLNIAPNTNAVMKDSPILELTGSMSRIADLTGKPFSRLVLISDLVVNSDGLTFCYKPDQRVPSYEKFTASPHWRRLKPSPFTGVEVEVLLLERLSQKLNCSTDELEDFWKAYFLKNGAKSAKFIRLREGI
jgi:hypothetical protein